MPKIINNAMNQNWESKNQVNNIRNQQRWGFQLH